MINIPVKKKYLELKVGIEKKIIGTIIPDKANPFINLNEIILLSAADSLIDSIIKNIMVEKKI